MPPILTPTPAGGGAGITDGDKGAIAVSSDGTVWEIDASGMAAIAASPALAAAYAPVPTADEEAIWAVRAAMLDPAAVVHRNGTFDVTLTNPEWVINSWSVYLSNDVERRFDVRVPPRGGMALPMVWPAGTRVRGLVSGAQCLTIDPTLVSYADPKATWHERMARLPTLTHRSDGESGAGALSRYLDTTRSCYLSPRPGITGDQQSGSTPILSANFGCTQRFRVGATQASGQAPLVSLYLSRSGSQTGDLIVEIRTDSGGQSSGTVIASATVASANLPALDAGPAWVDVTLSALTQNLTADTPFHLQLRTAATSVCNWHGAIGSDNDPYRGWSHTGSWGTPVGFVHYACKVNPQVAINYLITGINGFDTPWVIVQDEHNGGGANTWSEISDSTSQRVGHDFLLPWTLMLGDKWRFNGGVVGTRAGILLAELPSDW